MDKYFIQKEEDCYRCVGVGKLYHTRSCAEDYPSGIEDCYVCRGTGKTTTMIPCSIGEEFEDLKSRLLYWENLNTQGLLKIITQEQKEVRELIENYSKEDRYFDDEYS